MALPDMNKVGKDIKTRLTNLETNKAPLASPKLTGTPTAPTAAKGTNNTQIATTGFVTVACKSVQDYVNACALAFAEFNETNGIK